MRVALWLLQDSIRNVHQWIAGFYYVKHCLDALLHLPAGECPEVVVFVPASLRDRLLANNQYPSAPWLTIESIDDELMDHPAGRIQIEERVAAHQCDVLFPAITPPIVPVDARVIGWIADFQHRHYPSFFSTEERQFRERLFAFLSATCDRVACSSNNVAADFVRFDQAECDKTFVLRFTTQPPQDVYSSSGANSLALLGVTKPYVYLPNQFWIHKNHRRVLECWKLLSDMGHDIPLVCTGSPCDSRFPNYYRELTQFLAANGLGETVKVLGLVDRNDQWQLYRNAKLILQPSLFEGWSTSVEEARSLGKPVLLSDIAVHREQADSWGFFFDPHDSEALAKRLIELWPKLSDGLDSKSEALAKMGNSQRMEAFGRSLVELFADVAHSPRPNIAKQVLPLYLQMQSEAQERLKVIQDCIVERDQLKAELNRRVDKKQKGLVGSLKSILVKRDYY